MSTSQIALLASVQQFLDRQHGLYIDGAPCAAQSENRLTVWDPATGQAIATTADASPADVDRAVMSAWRAFVDRRWAGRTPADRERILLRFADLVEQHGEELAQLETLEQGKSIAISRAFEVGCTLNWMQLHRGADHQDQRPDAGRFDPVPARGALPGVDQKKSRSGWWRASSRGISR